jgi:hypothetical protein
MSSIDSTASIAANWQRLQERVVRAAEAACRDPGEIEVIAVTKTRSPQEIEAAIAAGACHIGENRVQEAAAKKTEVAAAARWHLIGRLQTNKAKRAVELFDLIQSVDGERLAAALDRRAAEANQVLTVLIQVNTAGAASQAGVSVTGLMPLVEQLAKYANLRTRGLMTIAEHTDDEVALRNCFRTLRELSEGVETAAFPGVEMEHLSMGMSGDFELAVAEGATMLRVGTAIFGPRA